MLSKARKTDRYENMSRQQLEILFIIPSAPTPTQRPVPRPKSVSLRQPQDMPQDLETRTPTPAPRLETPPPLNIPKV